jgi:uncharacterized protein YcfL
VRLGSFLLNTQIKLDYKSFYLDHAGRSWPAATLYNKTIIDGRETVDLSDIKRLEGPSL